MSSSAAGRASLSTSVRVSRTAMCLGPDLVELAASERHQLRCRRSEHGTEAVSRVVDLGAARRIERLDRMQHQGDQCHTSLPGDQQRNVRAVRVADDLLAMLASSELEASVRSRGSDSTTARLRGSQLDVPADVSGGRSTMQRGGTGVHLRRHLSRMREHEIRCDRHRLCVSLSLSLSHSSSESQTNETSD